MANTKEQILTTALRLFAVNGYEAVSVSQIAGELGMTKGALYRHYKNKREIFDSIFEYVCKLDRERSRTAGVPEQEFSEEPESFLRVSPENLKEYMSEQFFYWSGDETACNFRKMLTLEQYKTLEMGHLYQKVLTSGPLDYIENLFREMVKDRRDIPCSPRQMAIEFYAPFYLLLSVSDSAEQEKEREEIRKGYEKYMDDFFQNYSLLPGREQEKAAEENNSSRRKAGRMEEIYGRENYNQE